MAETPEVTSGKELGAKLRQVRGLKEKSLSAVAGRADISTAYLQKLETGTVRHPSPRILLQLSEALDMDYGELMRLAGYLIPNEPSRKGRQRRNELTHAMSSEALTEEEADELARYLDWYRSQRKASG
jgi:transcriptional regulator with XRE-family HTH domain